MAATVGVLLAGLLTKAGDGHDDRLAAQETWLIVGILTVGYMISRGLAKSGSREPYTETPAATTASRHRAAAASSGRRAPSRGNDVPSPLPVPHAALPRLLGGDAVASGAGDRGAPTAAAYALRDVAPRLSAGSERRGAP